MWPLKICDLPPGDLASKQMFILLCVCVCVKRNKKLNKEKKTCKFRGHRSQVYWKDWKTETQIFVRFDFLLVFFVPWDENKVFFSLIVRERERESAVRKLLGNFQSVQTEEGVLSLRSKITEKTMWDLEILFTWIHWETRCSSGAADSSGTEFKGL